jgi:hypothetical protein
MWILQSSDMVGQWVVRLTSELLGNNLEYRLETYCVREHVVYIDYHEIKFWIWSLFQRPQGIFPILLGNQSHVNIKNTQKSYNWSGTCFLSPVTRKLGSGIISMKRRLNSNSFLTKYSVYNKTLNCFTALYIWNI